MEPYKLVETLAKMPRSGRERDNLLAELCNRDGVMLKSSQKIRESLAKARRVFPDENVVAE